jgi:hypothetical protein
MSGKLDQETGKVKIEVGIACLTSAKARNTLPTRRYDSALARNDISLMHQLHLPILSIRLNTALATGGGPPAHA